jgi:hypothetical protein
MAQPKVGAIFLHMGSQSGGLRGGAGVGGVGVGGGAGVGGAGAGGGAGVSTISQ